MSAEHREAAIFCHDVDICPHGRAQGEKGRGHPGLQPADVPQDAARELGAMQMCPRPDRTGEVQNAEHRARQRGAVETRPAGQAAIHLQTQSIGIGQISAAEIDVPEYRVSQPGTAKSSVSQGEQRAIGRRLYHPIAQVRAVQHEPGRRRRRIFVRQGMKGIGKRPFAGTRPVLPGHGGESSQGRAVFLPNHHLPEEIERLPARPGQDPILRPAFL